MAEVAEQMFPGYSSIIRVSSTPSGAAYGGRILRDDEDDFCDSSLPSSEDSNMSGDSSSSLDLSEDATSSDSSSPAQVVTDGPLYELSSLMATLPIKRGLSKFYQGKSQSFTSLSEAISVEDLAKRETPYAKRMKWCKSYAGGLDCRRSYAPGACSRRITKNGASRTSSFSSLSGKRNSGFTAGRQPASVSKISNSRMHYPC